MREKERGEGELSTMAAVSPMSNPLTHCLKVPLFLSSQCSDDQTLKITCESFIQPATTESTLIKVIMSNNNRVNPAICTITLIV